MKNNGRKLRKNDAAFTGLEAAIVLIAFVVVAAVFSYVMLGAGFFTSQKAKETVHTGVDQATSSIQLSGDIIGEATSVGATGAVDTVILTLSLTAGNNPVDMDKLVVSWTTPANYTSNIYDASDYTFITNIGTANNLLEKNEKVMVTLDLGADTLSVNQKGTLEIKPATGAVMPITITAPPTIEAVMTL
jgi:archaeal flagellin FlaB